MISKKYYLTAEEYADANYLIYLKYKRIKTMFAVILISILISFIINAVFSLNPYYAAAAGIIIIILEAFAGELYLKAMWRREFRQKHFREYCYELGIINNLLQYTSHNFEIKSETGKVKNIFNRDKVIILQLNEKINVIIPKRVIDRDLCKLLQSKIPCFVEYDLIRDCL